MVVGVIKGGGKPDKTKELIRLLKESMSDQIELYSLTAKLQRAKYLALVAEGFLPNEALELAKTI